MWRPTGGPCLLCLVGALGKCKPPLVAKPEAANSLAVLGEMQDPDGTWKLRDGGILAAAVGVAPFEFDDMFCRVPFSESHLVVLNYALSHKRGLLARFVSKADSNIAKVSLRVNLARSEEVVFNLQRTIAMSLKFSVNYCQVSDLQII